MTPAEKACRRSIRLHWIDGTVAVIALLGFVVAAAIAALRLL